MAPPSDQPGKEMTDANPLPLRRSLRPLQIVVALFLGLRLVMHVFGAPLGDETYYWFWGQHPDDGESESSYLEERFATLSVLETVPVERFGVIVFNFRILLGEGYWP